jgi:hypothetical protein
MMLSEDGLSGLCLEDLSLCPSVYTMKLCGIKLLTTTLARNG